MGGRSAHIQPPLHRSGPGCQCLSGLMPTWNALPTPINPSSASRSCPLPTALGGGAAPRRPSPAQLTGSCPWRRRLGGGGTHQAWGLWGNEPEKHSGVCPEGRPGTGLRTDSQGTVSFSTSPGSSVLVLGGESYRHGKPGLTCWVAWCGWLNRSGLPFLICTSGVVIMIHSSLIVCKDFRKLQDGVGLPRWR